jgi:SAM-dependent methyltransferase
MDEQLLADFFTEEKKHWWHIAKRALINQFIKGKNLNILVAGVGGGMICDELRMSGHHVIGMDISPVSCEYANRKGDIPIINGDLEKPLPFTKESFDLVIIADVLEHLDNDNHLLAEAFLCLKSQGSVIITVPAYPHMWSSWDRRLHHKRRYSLAAIKRKVNEAGLKIYKASYYNMLLYPLVYIYRIILSLPEGECPEKSDFTVFHNKLVSGFFVFYYFLERFFLKIGNLPFGLSIFVVGIKHG